MSFIKKNPWDGEINFEKSVERMKSITSQKQFILSGKVVQTFENSGERRARIYIEPVSIDLFIDLNEEVNLGDIISFEVSLNDKTIKPVNNSLNPLPF